ncbi:SdrD B-like domain-containing protein [Kibdelosporangium aridum]|uniref:SdrD B-like domain-containing protein n=1 Tax=Kibdelosporangium aridum TaxID=2030 RepID=UPI000526939C
MPITLPSFSFGTGVIAVACGNYSEGVAPKPVPAISGVKFHDRDRDGVGDPGEPGLAGWTMTLHRDRSDAGQGLGAVATAVTNADGFYEFALDGHYPGDYSVTEENRADWAHDES